MRPKRPTTSVRANERPFTWPGPVGGCSLAMMILAGSWIEWQRVQTGTWDPWFASALAFGFLFAFAANAMGGAKRKWLVRAAAYFLVLPPVGLFAQATAHAAGWL